MIALYSTKNCSQHSWRLHCPRLRWTLKNCTEDRQELLYELQAALHCIVYYEKMHPMQTRTLLNTTMDCIVCICQGLHKILPKTSRCGGTALPVALKSCLFECCQTRHRANRGWPQNTITPPPPHPPHPQDKQGHNSYLLFIYPTSGVDSYFILYRPSSYQNLCSLRNRINIFYCCLCL